MEKAPAPTTRQPRRPPHNMNAARDRQYRVWGPRAACLLYGATATSISPRRNDMSETTNEYLAQPAAAAYLQPMAPASATPVPASGVPYGYPPPSAPAKSKG